MLFPKKYAVIWADVNLLIFQTESRYHFLELVQVLRHFVRLQKDIADQFHEIVVANIGEEILGLNGHQPGDEGKEGPMTARLKWCSGEYRGYTAKISTGSESDVSS
jgi:hypothetical protein